MRDDFAVMIISHGRPECQTFQVLKSSGYTGKIYIICDDEDAKLEQYKSIYGDIIRVFHKDDSEFDIGDNFKGPNQVCVFAKNECLKYAKELGLKYMLMMDDDLSSLVYRYNNQGKLESKKVNNFDDLLELLFDFLDSVDRLTCISFGRVMDYMGGVNGNYSNILNFSYNSFLFRVDKIFAQKGRIMEDAIWNVENIHNGYLNFVQKNVQASYEVWGHKSKNSQSGGMVEIYQESKKYQQNFYPVLFNPNMRYLEIDKEGKPQLRLEVKSKVFPRILREECKL